MRKLLIGAGVAAASVVAFPASSGAEFSYGIAQVGGKKLVVTFNDNAKCGLNVEVNRQGAKAFSDAHYYCWQGKSKQALKKDIRIKIVNSASPWLSFNKNRIGRTYKNCTGHECRAPTASYDGVKSNERAAGSAVFHIYYTRNAAFFQPPPGCEYVRDKEGKGPPGYRITCAIQAR